MPKLLRHVSMLVAALTVLVALTAPTPSRAQSATIELSVFKAGFIVGVSGGRGTLYYGGRAYPLSIGGVSLGATIGASQADLVGEVYNLHNPYDIAGTYSAAGAGVAIAGGARVAELQNSRGVVLKVRGKQIGLEFSLDLSGMQISLK